MKKALEMQLEALMQIHREILADAPEYWQNQEWRDSLFRSADDIQKLQKMIEEADDTDPNGYAEHYGVYGLLSDEEESEMRAVLADTED